MISRDEVEIHRNFGFFGFSQSGFIENKLRIVDREYSNGAIIASKPDSPRKKDFKEKLT
ncbi:putative endodeoxyribonuclease [Leptospira ellinghausenii]|uniref:Putative endodeoxyribonuclease n=1 Tax=Leptospira ellinghausenii TaxID=1917822 RepID=A0A2P2DBM6_9LEPT|nr:putative endodeoxyribonuclease [Leptospira ellinghausenii]